MFASNQAFDSGRVEFTSGPRGEDTELVRTPDLVVEILSRSTELKDTEWLMAAYKTQAFPNTGGSMPAMRSSSTSTNASRRSMSLPGSPRDWVRSGIFGKSFKLSRKEKTHGPRYKLHVR